MRQLDSTNAPRWEWRTFGVRLSDIEAIIGLAARIAPRRSDEIYLLNSSTPHSAKIRGGVLEVKRLLQVDSNGLERWSPAFKARFPLSVPMAQSAVAALYLRPLTTLREVCDLVEFLDLVANVKALAAAFALSMTRKGAEPFHDWARPVSRPNGKFAPNADHACGASKPI